MTFPEIRYKYNDLEEAQSLTAIVEQKFITLEKYLSGGGSAMCEVEFEKVTPQQHGKIYRVEANLNIDGVLYRAEATEESFEKAIDEVKSELDVEIRRAKDKQVSLDKDSGREMKERILSGE